MNYETIAAKVKNMTKGTIHTITYEKELKTYKGVIDKVSKKTIIQGRVGVNYDNMQVVKEGRENGTLPAENAGMPEHMRWIDDDHLFIINNKTGKIMLRVSTANSNLPKTQYYKNGVPVEKSEIESLCLKSETTHYGNSPSTVINLGIDKIVDIK